MQQAKLPGQEMENQMEMVDEDEYADHIDHPSTNQLGAQIPMWRSGAPASDPDVGVELCEVL